LAGFDIRQGSSSEVDVALSRLEFAGLKIRSGGQTARQAGKTFGR
jgi:hypothetical protein